MSGVTNEHPEFFKAPSERDAVPSVEVAAALKSAESHFDAQDEASVDELLSVATLPLLVDANPARVSAGTRKAAGLISLLGGLIFAIVYAAAVVGLIALRQSPEFVMASTLSFLATPIYWLTTALFTGSFALLSLILSRSTWIAFVIGSFLVGALTYAAALGASLIAIHAWELTFAEARTTLWDSIAFSPLILIAPIVGREIPLWLGMWISRRGKRLRNEVSVSMASHR